MDEGHEDVPGDGEQQRRPQLVPPVLYLPVEVDADGEVTDIRMLRLGDGRIALVAYTALDRFVACWGEQQAWALVNTAELPGIHERKPFDVKLLDVLVPEPVRSARPDPVPVPGEAVETAEEDR
jgi:hypothetical protein